ncbi:MAG: AraC family transcriptional regulator [Chitinophagaceae bacterium]
MDQDLQYRQVAPHPALSEFVDSFWMLYNASDEAKPVMGLPDGRIDLFLSQSATEPFSIILIGLGTHAVEAVIAPRRLMFAISFRLPGAEYLLQADVAGLPDAARQMPEKFMGFGQKDLDDFDAFCVKAQESLLALLPANMDERKRRLHELIHASHGAASVRSLSEQVYWSSRQINRYFNQQFGVSLKAYCSILRFRASLEHIARGRLFPELNFADQSHFIREVKKFSGVIPKELFKNQNDRFILLSAIARE